MRCGLSAAALSLAVSGAGAMPPATAILDFIGNLEAPGGYDQVHAAVPAAPPERLTEMTVGEVLDWQARIRPTAVSTAAGRYQIIRPTLARLVRRYGIASGQLFDAETQDALAVRLLEECGYRRAGAAAFANCLAGVWAALPRVSGPGAGLSAWHGTAGNRALATPAAVLDLLEGGRGAGGPRVRFRHDDLKGAIRRSVADAGRTGALGGSAVVRFAVDPYRTR